MEEKKLASNGVLWRFAIGQLGWAILSGIISNWLVYYYMPSETLMSQGWQIFITQGAVFAGLTVIGLITGCGRLLDGFIDPFIASKSDQCTSGLGRRIPFMRRAAIPFGLMTVLVFVVPGTSSQLANNWLLWACLMLFYITLSLYCTPFNALIPELGRTQETRINLSTYISTTYFFGTAFAYLVPNVAGMLEGSLGAVNAFRATVAILSVVAVILMLVPAFTIDEQEPPVPDLRVLRRALLGVDHHVPDGPFLLHHRAHRPARRHDLHPLCPHDPDQPALLRAGQQAGQEDR